MGTHTPDEYKIIHNRLTVKQYDTSVFVYDVQTGHSTVMDQHVYNEYLKNLNRRGTPTGWRLAGSDGRGTFTIWKPSLLTLRKRHPRAGC